MYLKNISLYNFRQFGVKENDSSGITIHLNPKFNILVGENDSGKTAIVDGIRYLLGSVSDDFEKISEEDFYSPSKDVFVDKFQIEGVFADLNDKEAGAFLEWLSFDENNNYILRLVLKVEKRKNENGIEYIDKKLLAGEENCESRMDSSARNLLKTTYLKPLRDANTELKPGFKSRLVNILKAHPSFIRDKEDNHKLIEIMLAANQEIESFFENEYIEGHSLVSDIKNLLKDFYDNLDESKSNAKFSVSKTDLTSILRKLSLNTEDINLGLGNLNLLFIATELLLLNDYVSDNEIIGPKITLIEEIEAHLHTQAQIRLIKFLESELYKKESKGQFILTSHSSNLVASINPQNIILLHNKIAYPLNQSYTMLEEDDYKFLERFLDSTKSNLFFAKGVILVEGESEMLLLPALANLIGYPLHKTGVSIVNIRGTSFERYIKLFSRSKLWLEEMNLPKLDMPISMITDLDIKPYIYYEAEEINKSIFNIKDKNELNSLLPHIGKSEDILKLEHLNKDYSTLRKLATAFGFNVTEQNEVTLTNLIKKDITQDYISEVSKDKIDKLNQQYASYNCNLNISIAPKWTLEFSLALSVLAKFLYTSIHRNRYVNPLKGIYLTEYQDMIRKIKDTSSIDDELAYEVFKPVNDKLVSKAEVAQMMATFINKLIEKSPSAALALKNEVLSDEYLEYLISAILHASNVSSPEVEVPVYGF